jgi:hypothetical protein
VAEGVAVLVGREGPEDGWGVGDVMWEWDGDGDVDVEGEEDCGWA